MVKNNLSYVWTPLFLAFSLIEFNSPISFCGSMGLTGHMWFMWLMMSLSASGKYIELIENKIRSKQ